jgi:uracil-DNA glycosylase
MSLSTESDEKVDMTSKTENTVIVLPKGWEKFIIDLKEELDEIFEVLQKQIQKGIEIYPKFDNILKPFYETPLEKVKIVIIGQEPYHNPGQANGLAFSVDEGIKIPPTLENIYQEIKKEIDNFKIPNHGNLTKWAKQGILLLNCSLTVEKKRKTSHEIVWRGIIREAVKKCSNKGGVIFVLWGKEASTFDRYIDTSINNILKTSHPSPYSADKGFFGCNHFKMINELLENPINWNI